MPRWGIQKRPSAGRKGIGDEPQDWSAELSETRAAAVRRRKVMIEQGYAGLTARTVAESVGLKHQLVYYYFLTMEEVLIAAFRRRTSQVMVRIEEAMNAPEPLRALRATCSEPTQAAVSVKYMALANYNEAIRREPVRFGEQVRRVGVDRVAGLLAPPLGETGVLFTLSPWHVAIW